MKEHRLGWHETEGKRRGKSVQPDIIRDLTNQTSLRTHPLDEQLRGSRTRTRPLTRKVKGAVDIYRSRCSDAVRTYLYV